MLTMRRERDRCRVCLRIPQNIEERSQSRCSEPIKLPKSGVQTLYIEPGKPWQNGKEERFNGTIRDECLNRFVFGSIAEACVRLNSYRHEYNSERPHSSLGYLIPHAFRAAWSEAQ